MKYYGDVYRPPSEARSLIIQVTLGCSHNTCAFCNMYKSKRYLSRPLREVLGDLKEISDAGYSHRVRRIFLADGDALARDADELVSILDSCFRYFPSCERVTSYASPGSLLLKTDEELKAIREHGLTMVYLGLESGSDEVLKLMRKGYGAARITEAGLKAKAAGMILSVTAIAGLGGHSLSDIHAAETARVLSRMNPEYAALMTLEVCRGTPLENWIHDGSFRPLSADEILLETRKIIELMDCPGCVFRSNHASNYLALAGTLNQDRQRLLDTVDAALGGRLKLRPEWMRGL